MSRIATSKSARVSHANSLHARKTHRRPISYMFRVDGTNTTVWTRGCTRREARELAALVLRVNVRRIRFVTVK